MQSKKMILLAILFVHLVSAWGKCPLVGYSVGGIVLGEDGKPIPGATVAITSMGEFLPQHPVIVVANERGEFEVHMRFDTYSGGGVSGDDCFRKPGRVSIAVQASGYNPGTKMVSVGEGSRAAANVSLVRSPE